MKSLIKQGGIIMKLFLIHQRENNGYDTYDSAVVCAETEDDARHTNPGSGERMKDGDWDYSFISWCSSPDRVVVEYLGEASDGIVPGIICASFNAG
jgi:hypothetical protein